MKTSCGILPYRITNNQLEVFLVHPGGPFFAKKDEGFWGISKGEMEGEEDKAMCAIREFKEETGVDLVKRKDELIDLGEVIQKNGKKVKAFAIQDNLESIIDNNGKADLRNISNKVTVTIKNKSFEVPEIDRGEFMKIDVARVKINPKQAEFLNWLEKLD